MGFPLIPHVPIPTRPFTLSGDANILFFVIPFFAVWKQGITTWSLPYMLPGLQFGGMSQLMCFLNLENQGYLILCGLCNKTGSSSDYIPSNDRMINEWIGKGMQGSSHGLIPAPGWRDWGKPLNLSGQRVSRLRFKPKISWIIKQECKPLACDVQY
jgi:hypothetical protein